MSSLGTKESPPNQYATSTPYLTHRPADNHPTDAQRSSSAPTQYQSLPTQFPTAMSTIPSSHHTAMKLPTFILVFSAALTTAKELIGQQGGFHDPNSPLCLGQCWNAGEKKCVRTSTYPSPPFLPHHGAKTIRTQATESTNVSTKTCVGTRWRFAAERVRRLQIRDIGGNGEIVDVMCVCVQV
jgi:hypothetical protein